jgi:Domain of unknown function (DUF4956)
MEPTLVVPSIAVAAQSLLLNVVASTIFAFAIYYRRHQRRDMAVVFWFFNVCLFVMVTVIQMTEVAAALGFGLFAILSIIRLRSEPFSNYEIGYFFGALVLGLLNGIGTSERWFTVLLNAVLLVSIAVLDNPRRSRSAERRPVTFDRVIADRDALRVALAERLSAEILDVTVVAVDFVKDSMQLEVTYRAAPMSMSAPIPSQVHL